MKQGLPIFDTHTHVGQARHSGRCYTADQLLRQMDEYGVDRSVVIPFPVVDSYRDQHDLIGRAVLDHPDRLVGTACLPPLLPFPEFEQEVRRCREVFGFRALKLQPQYHGLNPAAASSDFFFQTALDNDMAVICHTGSGLPFSAPSLLIMPALKFPQLRLVLGHAGGGIFVQEAIVAASVCTNVRLELSTLMPHQVLEVLKQVPSSRLMIGSDLPENLSTELGKIIDLAIPTDDKRNILYETAVQTFL